MENNYIFDIFIKNNEDIILKIVDYIQPICNKELNNEESNNLFNKDYHYIGFNHINAKCLLIYGRTSELNTAIEFASMINKIYNIKYEFHYENLIQNVAADQEYNEDGICTFDKKSTYWKWKYIQGDFFHEFDIIGENIHTHEQLSDFLLKNDIKVKDEFDMEVMISQTKIK